jgi:hypothetical protein
MPLTKVRAAKYGLLAAAVGSAALVWHRFLRPMPVGKATQQAVESIVDKPVVEDRSFVGYLQPAMARFAPVSKPHKVHKFRDSSTQIQEL